MIFTRIKEITPEEFEEFILGDEVLYTTSMSDVALEQIRNGEFKTNPEDRYIGLYGKKNLLCCFHLGNFTNVIAHVHMYLKSDWWGTGLVDRAGKMFMDWAKEEGKYFKFVTLVPRCCHHVIARGIKNGAEIVGTMKNSTYWRGKLEDVVILSKDVWEVK